MNRKLLALYSPKWYPFSPDIPDDALWRPPAIEDFCWRIEQKVREGGFILVTGGSGTGKSAVLRLLARHLAGLPELVVGILNRPQNSLPDFYRELGEIFGVSLVLNNRCRPGHSSITGNARAFRRNVHHVPLINRGIAPRGRIYTAGKTRGIMAILVFWLQIPFTRWRGRSRRISACVAYIHRRRYV